MSCFINLTQMLCILQDQVPHFNRKQLLDAPSYLDECEQKRTRLYAKRTICFTLKYPCAMHGHFNAGQEYKITIEIDI